MCETSCYKKFFVFYFANIYILHVPFISYFIWQYINYDCRQAPKAQQQVLDLLSEEKCNLVILPKDITISLRQENTKYLNFVANLLEKNT